MYNVKENIMKGQLVACGISNRVKISGAATNMHNKRKAKETCQRWGTEKYFCITVFPCIYISKMLLASLTRQSIKAK